MDEKLIELATLLSEKCNWPIDIDDLDSPFKNPFYTASQDELGLPDDMDIELVGYQLVPPQGFEDKMQIHFLSIEGTGRLHVTRLRAILKALARKGKRVQAGEGRAIDVGVEDIIFVCSLLEPKNTTRYFCHFQDKEDGKRPKLMIGPRWEDAQSEAEKERVVARLRNNLQWPDEEISLDVWRDEWSKAFTVEHLYVPKTSKQLAKRLAVLAAQIRESIPEMYKLENEKGPIHTLLEAFSESLIKDLKLSAFADMVAQTIAYGLFSARASGSELSGIETLAECIPSTNPFLRDLFSEFASLAGDNPTDLDFDDLSLDELVEMLNLCNIDAIMGEFGSQFKGGKEDPVIHFYETFLKEYNNQLKFDRGVFYTPKPIVTFIIKSIDEQLRSNFGLEDGLADITTWGEMIERNPNLKLPAGVSLDQAFVHILDPATGTGTFLIETISLIHSTMNDKWESKPKQERQELWNTYVSEHLLPRLVGYELLMAPYSMAHLRIALALSETGFKFKEGHRLQVYLTNSLELPAPLADWVPSFLSQETHSVNLVKSNAKFTVVLGNPPYSKASDNAGKWITQLVEDYKKTVRKEESQIQAISNDYIKFLRLCEWNIESTGVGVIGLITPHGYLYGTQPRDLRKKLNESFCKGYYLDLHGSIRRSTTDDSSDKPVFEITTGVAIMVCSRSPKYTGPGVTFQDSLTGNLTKKFNFMNSNTIVTALGNDIEHYPTSPNYFFINKSIDGVDSSEYDLFPELPSFFGMGDKKKDKEKYWATGFTSQQDQLAISFTEKELEEKMAKLATAKSFKQLNESYRLCTTNQWNFDKAVDFAKKEKLWRPHVSMVTYRPFDRRWTVLHKHILTIMRNQVMSKLDSKNNDDIALVSSRAVNDLKFAHCMVVNERVDRTFLSSKSSTNAYVFPIQNFRKDIIPAIKEHLMIEDQSVSQEKCLNYIYAILHSNGYRKRYPKFLKNDFPRIPITSNFDLFNLLDKAGQDLIALHLMKNSAIDTSSISYNGAANQKIENVSYSEDTIWINKEQNIGFKSVSNEVWEFSIGGYKVCQKWLNDRRAKGGKKAKPGQALTKADIEHYKKIILTISETICIMKEIDESIQKHGGWPLEGSDEFEIPPTREPGQKSLGEY